jgi:RecB family exonuclease
VWDEHKAYSELSKSIVGDDAKGEVTKTNIIFWGFSHISNSQIEFLNSLSIIHDVYVPLPKEVLAKSKSSDWVSWLNNESADMEGYEPEDINNEIYTFSKGRLAETLKNYRLSNSSESIDYIILADKDPQSYSYRELPFEDVTYVSNYQLFTSELKRIHSRFVVEFVRNRKAIPVEELQEELVEQRDLSLKARDYKMYSTYKRFLNSLENYVDFTELETLSPFDVSLLVYNLELDSPRTYFMKPHDGGNTIRSFGLKKIDQWSENTSGKTILIIKKNYSLSFKRDSELNENMYEFISSLGPVQRGELDKLFVQAKIRRILKNDNTVVFIEDGLLETDMFWNGLFSEDDSIKSISNSSTTDKMPPIGFAQAEHQFNVDHISATSIQKYIDCPLSFYYNYVDKLRKDVLVVDEVLPRALGVIEHEVVGQFFDEKRSLVWSEIFELSKKCLDEYVEKERMKLPAREYEAALQEITQYSFNGIKIINSLLEELAGEDPQLFFEKKMEQVRGSADLVITTNERSLVLDFKRTSASIPSASEIEKLSSVQVLFYLKHLELEQAVSMFGYVNLSEPEESLLLQSEATFSPSIKTKKRAVKDLEGIMTRYGELEEKIISDLKDVELFVAKPKKQTVCQFCVVKSICNRGEGLANT